MDEELVRIEETVLGSMILEERIARDYAHLTKGKYFTHYKREKILEIIQDLVNRQEAVDLITVTQEMVKRQLGPLDECGREVLALQEAVVSTVHTGRHIEMLRQEWLRRELGRLGRSLQSASLNRTLTSDSLIEEFENKLTELRADRPWESVFQTQQQVADLADDEYMDRMARKSQGGLTGISTGIDSMDRFTGGWQANELIVIGGQNGDGKSWFMVHHLMAAATKGYKCLVYSLEMSNTDVYARELMMMTDLDGHDWYQGISSVDKNIQKMHAKESLDKLPITYMDHNEYDIERLCSMAREQHQKGNCEILFIDYAQIIRATERMENKNRVDVVTDFTRRLKELAKQLNIPVIILAQLNRNQTKAQDGRPSKSDLRESGSLEQDADRILLIWRPYQYKVLEYGKKRLPTENMVVYIGAKGRHFGPGEFLLRHNESFTRFEEF